MTNVASTGQLFTAPVCSDISKVTNAGLRPWTSSITCGRGANQPAGAPSGRDGSGAGSPWTPSSTAAPEVTGKHTALLRVNWGCAKLSQTAPFLHESPMELPACSLASCCNYLHEWAPLLGRGGAPCWGSDQTISASLAHVSSWLVFPPLLFIQ